MAKGLLVLLLSNLEEGTLFFHEECGEEGDRAVLLLLLFLTFSLIVVGLVRRFAINLARSL